MEELKKYLRINAIFSALSGLTMLFFSRAINELFTIQHVNFFPYIGADLLLFSVFVGFVSIRHLKNKTLVSTITVLDILWVLSSFLIVLLAPFGISNWGNIIISLIAVWIAFLAYKQYLNNRNLK